MQKYLKTIDEVIARGPYDATWASLSRYKTPDWYKQLKFGIFIHLGVYIVPACVSEWYSLYMYILGSKEFEHHV